MAMTFLTQASLFIFHTIYIIAIAWSFPPRDRVCVSLASHLNSPNTSSVYGLLAHTVHRRLCGQGYLADRQDNWNLFYHLGGNGPWIEKTDATFGTYEEDGKPPEGCVVDQVHMLSRHAERYPTKNAGARHLALLPRLESQTLNGSLSFINHGNWTYFTPPTPPSFEDLTTTSPYAGTLSAFTLGTTLRSRYSHLLPSLSASSTSNHTTPVSFWSASSPRDVETALYFADGFFGRDWAGSSNINPTARLHIVPEIPSCGGNTLTPSRSCLRYQLDQIHGHDQGYTKLAEWQAIFTKPISDRLSAENPNLNPNFTAAEIYSMMELCGFEMLARGSSSDSNSGGGSSPWCSLFTHAEWEDFEYARDVLHFYRAGPGNPYAGAMGSLWLDAVSELIIQDSTETDGGAGSGGIGIGAKAGTGEIYASFVHDGDVVPVLAALGIFEEDGEDQMLPTDHVKRDRKWRTSDLVPMAGRLVIERLNCRTPHGWRYRDVRLWINDGWMGWVVDGAEERTKVYIPQMEVGRFRDMVRRKKEGFGGFAEVCGLEEGVEEGIAFLHQ